MSPSRLSGLRMCKHYSNMTKIYAEVNTSTNCTFCVSTFAQKINDLFLIDKDVFSFHDSSTNVRVTKHPGQIFMEFYINFFITNVTNRSFKNYEITLSDSEENTLNLFIEVLQSELVLKTEPKVGALYESLKADIICHSSHERTMSLHLYKQGIKKTLMSSNNKTLTYTFKPLRCQDMGYYTCVLNLTGGDKQTTNLDVKLNHCPPVLCNGQLSRQSHQVELGGTVTINYCVVSPDLTDQISINEQVYILNQPNDGHIQVMSNISLSPLYRNISIHVSHIGPGDDQVYTVILNSSTGRQLHLQFELVLQSDNLHLCQEELKEQSVSIAEGHKLTLSRCINVSLHNELHRLYVIVNRTTFYKNQCIDTKCVVWSRQDVNTTLYTIFIVIESITSLDFGELNVTVGTKYNHSQTISVIHYTFNIIRQVNCSLKAEVTSPTGDSLNISWSSDLCPTVHLLVTASNRIIQNVTYRSDTRDVHVTGLQQETIYKIQMQCLSKEDKFGSPSCIQTLYHHTDKSSELPDSTSKSNNGEIVLISTIVVSLVLLSALALLIMIRTKLQSQKKNHASMSQTERIRSTKAHPQSYLRLFPAGLRSINRAQSTSQDIAEYCNWRPTVREESVNSKETGRSVSREGLLYVTLDHSHYKKKRKAKKQSSEKIVYAELKF
ncbi:uncharacterized protein LOC106075472 isoform X2 [Biomphalaria glabrata]|uniref:Uncharacterized protein LOC106075472 isoform X2 n=1 Tax=Biomphalaria glabrata TaxID=6526 RepID=A0A9W2YUR4_BIOGL|nr:uncharacterized protein LOC106075472 isoform X2 [Biomphalaria glabrata]